MAAGDHSALPHPAVQQTISAITPIGVSGSQHKDSRPQGCVTGWGVMSNMRP